MKLIKNGLSLIVLTFILFGCLDYKEKMKLNSDLSGEMVFSVGINEQLLSLGGPNNELEKFDENTIKENYSNKKGIRFISGRTYSEEGNKWIEIKIAFERIEDLIAATVDSTQKGMIGEISITENAEGNYVFVRKLFGSESLEDSTSEEFSKDMMEMMFGNYKWKYELILPSEIITSNADQIEESTNTAKWTFSLSSVSTQKTMTVTFSKDQFLDVDKTIAAIVIVIAFAIFIYLVLRKRKLRR